jgi:hypothetical protein
MDQNKDLGAVNSAQTAISADQQRVNEVAPI